MRQMRIIYLLCLLLLFVPIYLWKVQGWWSGGNTAGQVPADRLEIAPDNKNSSQDPQKTKLDDIASLAKSDPVGLLYECLSHYKQMGVNGYTCTLVKQERIKGTLNPKETIEAWFREEPYSVLMHWKEGAGLAAASLYVKGENDGYMCIRPAGFGGKLVSVAKRMPDCSEAKSTTRYLITEFGVRCGTERTYKVWKGLKDEGKELKTEYVGLIKSVPEVGGRDCHVIKRYCDPPEEEGLTEITIYIDAETWLQVGTILKAKGDLIGSYFFKDIKLNPTFDASQFKLDTLKKF